MAVKLELRGQLEEIKFNEVKARLSKESSKEWPDDREVAFFIIPNINLKVTKYLSKNTAKIVYKNALSSEVLAEELSIPINPEDFEGTVRIFTELGYTNVQRSNQKRTNYLYKDVIIALKYSEDWKYHFEIERIIKPEERGDIVRDTMESIATELGLIVMSSEEINNLIVKVNQEHHIN
ncbi:MAG: CYTH domain-containing protein [Candidatus Dojkabacteria bacterium]